MVNALLRIALLLFGIAAILLAAFCIYVIMRVFDAA